VSLKLRAAFSGPAALAPTWEKVVREAISIKGPDQADTLEELAKFAAQWAGGDASPALKEVESYAKQLARRNEPEKDQLGFLAVAKLVRYPDWPIMCLKTLISSPDKWAIKGEAKMFNSTIVREMETTKAAKIAEACSLSKKARAWFGEDLIGHPAFSAKVFGDMQVRLVMFVHGFRVKSRPWFESMEEICIDFAKQVRDLNGDMSKCPWKLTDAAAPAATTTDAPKVDAIVEYAPDGSLEKEQLKTLFGMELGTTVTLKVPTQTGVKSPVYSITSMEGKSSRVVSVVIIGTDADASPRETTVGELVDLYKTVKFVPDIVVRAGDILPVETFEDVVTEYLKSSVKLLLFSAFRLHKPKVDLKIKGDDTNQVFASGDYPDRQMKLVPFSKSVFVIVEGKGKSSSTSVEIKLTGPKSSSKYVAIVSPMSFGKIDRGLKKPLNDTIVAPYWLVRRVLDKSMANMQNTTMACPLTTEPGIRRRSNM